MKNKIIEFNNLYNPALERIKQVQMLLGRHRIEHVFSYYYSKRSSYTCDCGGKITVNTY